MPKTAIMIRVSDEELAEINRLAKDSGATRAGWCVAAVRRRIEDQSTPRTPDVTVAQYVEAVGLKLPPEPLKPWVSKIPTDAPTVAELRAKIPESTRGFAKSPTDCSHNFRNHSGYCPTCGDQR